MAIKLNLCSKEILDMTFSGVTHGYNSLEVDSFLDSVIRDYQIIESNFLITKQDIETLQNKINDLEEKNKLLEIENKKYQVRFDGIKNNDKNISADNINLVKRISALEKFLWKQGFNPNTIK
ncbi:MAG: DivIVA domain-containing protein [Bacilli bacterium]